MDTLWIFNTSRFTITWEVEEEFGYIYDGDDADGSIQAALDDGEMVAFDSTIRVCMDGLEVGAAHLGGSVYRANEVESFRDHLGLAAKRRADGLNYGSYFSDMVREAIGEARKAVAAMPKLRTIQP